MFSYEEFKDYVKEHLREHLPDGLKDAEIMIKSVQKNNGVKPDGVMLYEGPGSVSPVVYLENYYLEYVQDEKADDAVKKIAGLCSGRHYYDNGLENVGEVFMDFDRIKENIVVAAVNAKSNEGLLKDTPHVIREDLALIYKVLLKRGGPEFATVTVKNQHMELWNTDVETLNKLAMENSRRLMPAVIKDMNEVMLELMGDRVTDGMFELIENSMPEKERMYVITNPDKMYGAGAVFYDEEGVAALADKLGSDLYILPSSIHEMLAVSAEHYEPETLTKMVIEVNAGEVEPEEQLSNNVYRYDSASHTLSLATEEKAPELLEERRPRHISR